MQANVASCYRCLKSGHWQRFCPQNPDNLLTEELKRQPHVKRWTIASGGVEMTFIQP